jgi:hypothetical protein
MYLKNYRLCIVIVLYFHAHAAPYAHEVALKDCQQQLQNLNTGLNALGASFATAVVGYLSYTLYLDRTISAKETFWHWATHHMHDGFIDQLELLTYVQNKYPIQYAIHPLTAIFAMVHDVSKEISSCLSLRAKIQTFNTFMLSGLLTESVITLDKKIENLYLLKLALNNCAAETRKRCRKLALS